MDSLRKTFLIYATLITVLIVLYINGTLSLSEILSYGSIASFPEIMWLAFDRWVWRWDFLQRYCPNLPPDLIGTWSGSTTPEHDGTKEHVITYIIAQTYSKIFITSDSDRVYSPCKIASLHMGDNDAWYITFTWDGWFKEKAPQSGRVTGASFLCLDIGKKKLIGNYLASGQSLTRGQIFVERRCDD